MTDALAYQLQTNALEMMSRYDYQGATEMLERVQEARGDRYLYHYPLSLFLSSLKSGLPLPPNLPGIFYSTGIKCRRFDTAGSDEYIYGDAVGICRLIKEGCEEEDENCERVVLWGRDETGRDNEPDCLFVEQDVGVPGVSPSQMDSKESRESRRVVRVFRSLFRSRLIASLGKGRKGSRDGEESRPWITSLTTYCSLVCEPPRKGSGKHTVGTNALSNLLHYYYLSLYDYVRGEESLSRVWCRRAIEEERKGGGGGGGE